MIVCKKCDSQRVQIVMWVNPNTLELLEDYGTFGQRDTGYCERCDDLVGVRDTNSSESSWKEDMPFIMAPPKEMLYVGSKVLYNGTTREITRTYVFHSPQCLDSDLQEYIDLGDLERVCPGLDPAYKGLTHED